jgi:hypothetical protein
MALYVDKLREHYKMRGLLRGTWCHLATDGTMGELHAFAAKIGLPARAFHAHEDHPHYDLTPAARAVAVAEGAIEVTSKELVKRCFRAGRARADTGDAGGRR